MAKIGSTDLALVTARVGCARLGASRLGFYPFDVKGPGSAYPCEYNWREVKPPTTQWTLVHEGVVCGQRPVAAFSMAGTTLIAEFSEAGQAQHGATANTDVTFADATSGGTAPYTYDWDFGDGSPHSTDQNPVHEYVYGVDDPATYTVVLIVTDTDGVIDGVSHDVEVSFFPV